ncbi:MAG: alpha/beta hydrolase [Planctomycetota bacterium]|jgi:acetyl esterase/lipase
MLRLSIPICCIIALLFPDAFALVAKDNITIKPDVVYGHKHGMALTMDVFQPEKANGAGVLFMVSGGWFSKWAPPEQSTGFFKHLLDKGFTVFAVRHGSSPKYLVPEIVEDVRRSVRFVRLRAKEYGVDPERLGVCGFSAGGHLSLMLGMTSDNGDPSAKDEIQKVSNRVAAVVAYFPPTDLRPYVKAGDAVTKFFPALGFDPNDANDVSPLLHASEDDPPALMIHGDKDFLVPLWHSEKMQEALKAKGVESELIVIKGGGHGFSGKDARKAANAWGEWFEKHLLKAGQKGANKVKD